MLKFILVSLQLCLVVLVCACGSTIETGGAGGGAGGQVAAEGGGGAGGQGGAAHQGGSPPAPECGASKGCYNGEVCVDHQCVPPS